MNSGAWAVNEAEAAMAAIRSAQPDWANRPVDERLAVIRRLRRLLARECRAWANTVVRPNMSEADVLVAEVVPSLSACRFLEAQAARILKPRRPVGRRPVWLTGTRLVVRRVPFGGVLILSPRNYPLLLPTIQALQALVAGNGVMVKPAPGLGGPMLFLGDALRRAGLPTGLFATLSDTHATGSAALCVGADKVVLTGGGETGRRVLAQLAETLTPATMELSGNDALLLLPGAPIEVVARAIVYGLSLNGGETCIAPRRIIAAGDTGPAVLARLEALLPGLPPAHVAPAEALRLQAAFAAAQQAGGRIIGDPAGLGQAAMRPLVMLAAEAGQQLPPLFGPAASLIMVADTEAAVAAANDDPHALGASVFGPARAARAAARRLRAGCVTVNDVIVSTADPRLPFGGAGASGFGVTRGAEGLLEMTRPQALVSRNRAIAVPYRRLPDSSARWIARGVQLLYR